MVALAAAAPREAPSWGWDLRLPRYCGGKSLRRSRWILAFPSTQGATEWHTQSISPQFPMYKYHPPSYAAECHTSIQTEKVREGLKPRSSQTSSFTDADCSHATFPPAGPQHAPSAFPNCPLLPVSLSPSPPFTRSFSLRALCYTSKSPLFYQAPS